jgi:hypothetical protein
VYEAATNLDENCWGINFVKVCHAPTVVAAYTEGLIFYIDLATPEIPTYWRTDSFMSVMVLGDGSVGLGDNLFHCCETRPYVDTKLDTLVDEAKSVYPTSRTRGRLVGCTEKCP